MGFNDFFKKEIITISKKNQTNQTNKQKTQRSEKSYGFVFDFCLFNFYVTLVLRN